MTETWEARMAERARDRLVRASGVAHGDVMAPWRLDSDPDEINPQILAARCLGIQYGDPGPALNDMCRECWGDRHVWLGNVWGVQHVGGTMSGCTHECHSDEVWLA